MAWLTGWSKRKAITIPAANVTGTHTDLPTYLHAGGDAYILGGLAFPDGRDLRITGDDGTTVLDYEIVPDGQFWSINGIWTWYHNPRAIYYEGPSFNKTYVGSLTVNVPSVVASYDHDNETWAYGSPNIASAGSGDDHNHPVLVMRSDHKLIVFTLAHQDTRIRYYIASNAEDVTAWGSEQTVDPDSAGATRNYSYPNPVRLSSEGSGSGRIYLFYDIGTTTREWCFIYSDDDGATWSAQTKWWTPGANVQPYAVFHGNGVDRIDVLFTPDDHRSEYVYHVYYDGTWRASDGTAMPAMPWDASDIDPSSIVHDGDATNDDAWMWQIRYVGGAPKALYVKFPNAAHDTDHRYMYAAFNGSTWDNTEIAADTMRLGGVDEPGYSAGIHFNDDDTDTVYLAKSVSSIFEIQRWTRNTGTGVWSKAEDITTGSTYHNFRPVIPDGCPEGSLGRLMWVGNGTYTGYDDYHTGIRAYPPFKSLVEHVWFKAPNAGSTDQAVYVYYGNPSASDAQDAAGLWTGYAHVSHATVHPVTGHVNTITDQSGNAKTYATVGGYLLPDYASALPAIKYHALRTVNDEALFTTFDFAGLTDFHVLVIPFLWVAIDANECFIIGCWNNGTTNGNWQWRMEPSGNLFEGLSIVEANTLRSGTFTGLTATQNAYHSGSYGFDHDVAQIGRLDKTEVTSALAGSAAIDATASSALQIGRGAFSGGDPLRGSVGHVRITTGSVRSKNLTDTTHDMIFNSAFLTVGSEESNGLVIPIAYHFRQRVF